MNQIFVQWVDLLGKCKFIHHYFNNKPFIKIIRINTIFEKNNTA
jgi:hypothetical protein